MADTTAQETAVKGVAVISRHCKSQCVYNHNLDNYKIHFKLRKGFLELLAERSINAYKPEAVLGSREDPPSLSKTLCLLRPER